MILVDTSAWIEYLRATGSPAHHRVRRLLAAGDDLATTEPVRMELLAGARDDLHLQRLRRLMDRASLLPVEGLVDFEDAADVFRRCRRAGETMRSLIDCLIAVVVMRNDADVLHVDRDFEAIARHHALRVLPIR